VQLADYKKKLDDAVQSVDSYEEAKKKTAYELDAHQQAIDALTSDNDKLSKSKKKIQSEVTIRLYHYYYYYYTRLTASFPGLPG